jgi:hypothetical protein
MALIPFSVALTVGNPETSIVKAVASLFFPSLQSLPGEPTDPFPLAKHIT